MRIRLLVLCGIAVGYALGTRHTRHRVNKILRRIPEPKPLPPIPHDEDSSAYDAVYSPEQQQWDKRALELQDQFSKLNMEIAVAIVEKGIDSPEVLKLKFRKMACLELLLEYDDAQVYQMAQDELKTQLAGLDDYVL